MTKLIRGDNVKGLIGVLAALVFLLVACSTDAEPSSPAVSLDFETCQDFLNDPAPDLISKTTELTEIAKNDNPVVETMCMVSHQRPDGSKAMTLAVTKFDTSGAADSQYNVTRSSLEQGDTVQFDEGVDGPQSFQAVANAVGVGSFVVIRKELVVISLHTTMPAGVTRISDPEELLDVAKSVTAKLP